MVLEAIEDRLRTPLSDEQHCSRGTYTIEHVLPQGWGQYWPLPAGDPQLLTFERDRIVQRLGNLTLVNNKLNPSLSNRPWTDAEAQAAGYDFGKRSLLPSVSFEREIVQLYDLAEDPFERNDVYSAARLREPRWRRLYEAVRAHRGHQPDRPGASLVENLDPEVYKDLKALGYIQ